MTKWMGNCSLYNYSVLRKWTDLRACTARSIFYEILGHIVNCPRALYTIVYSSSCPDCLPPVRFDSPSSSASGDLGAFFTFGTLRLTSLCKWSSSALAFDRISLVSIAGSSFILTRFCLSTPSFNQTSCSLSAASNVSSSSAVHFEGTPAAASAVRLALASPRKSRVDQFHFWLLFNVSGNSSISL